MIRTGAPDSDVGLDGAWRLACVFRGIYGVSGPTSLKTSPKSLLSCRLEVKFEVLCNELSGDVGAKNIINELYVGEEYEVFLITLIPRFRMIQEGRDGENNLIQA